MPPAAIGLLFRERAPFQTDAGGGQWTDTKRRSPTFGRSFNQLFGGRSDTQMGRDRSAGIRKGHWAPLRQPGSMSPVRGHRCSRSGASSQSGSEEGWDPHVSRVGPSVGASCTAAVGNTLRKVGLQVPGKGVLCCVCLRQETGIWHPCTVLRAGAEEALSNSVHLVSGGTRGCSGQCEDEPGGRRSEGQREDTGD